LASDNTNQVTEVLGDEFDESLRQRLIDVLRKAGACQPAKGDRFTVGSQDLEKLDVEIGGHILHIEAETYVGLSITGSADLVEQVRRLVLQ
jgi:hypothetical protein